MSAPRVVVDASVLLAFMLTPNRRSTACLLMEAIAVGAARLVVSAPIAAEYRTKVATHLGDARIEDPLAFVEDLVRTAEQVVPLDVRAVAEDPSDDVYLGTALAAAAGYLVTFDRRHLLPLDPYQEVRVITPAVVVRALADVERAPRKADWLEGALGPTFWEPLPLEELDLWER